MATQVDLQVGLNILVGGVPVALQATLDSGAEQTVYTFDGSVQSATLPLERFLSLLGSQFGVDVEMPPELALQVLIDYVVGQVIYTKPTDPGKPPATQLAAAAKFEFTADGHTLTLHCFVAAQLSSGSTASSPYVVGAAIDTNLAFSSLPLVGKVPGFSDLTLQQLGFSYTNVKPGTTPPVFQIPQVTATKNPLYTRSGNAPEEYIYSITSAAAPGNYTMSSGGFSLTVGLVNSKTGATMNNFALPLSMPGLTPPAPAALPTPVPFYSAAAASPPAGPVHWITINKTFGPVNLQQIGLNYSGGAATFGFSAAFALGGFSMALEGLSITFPVSQTCTQGISFDLQGLSFGFTEGGFSMNGAFLATATPPVSYYGELAVQAGTFGFQAMGGYTPSTKSFFIYAHVEIPLGGPPFLFVTGLAGGFGINSQLVLPTFDDLSSCVFLPSSAPPQAATPAATMAQVLPKIEKAFPPEDGEYWIAAGVQFTSFEMITAFVLVTVSFGVDLQLGLLGSCSMSLPVGEPLAYIEIDILASFTPASGLFAVMGKLSPASYLLGGFVKLTGGFAFYIWVSGENQGNFLVSIGGYSTAYTKPAIYPAVPRLGLSFGLGPFQAGGSAYFALLPSMMMAGIFASATWNLGPIKAWFDLGVEFMIGWAPLVYSAHAYVDVGFSANLGLFTLKLQIGADLMIWGPSFGGTAEIDLDIVSFTIGFGSSSPPAVPPLGWSSFKNALLPADSGATKSAQKNRAMLRRNQMRREKPGTGASGKTLSAEAAVVHSNIIKASVQAGLINSEVTGPDGEYYDWVVKANGFEILTASAIPANNAQWTLSTGPSTLPGTLSSYNVLPPAANTPWLYWDTSVPTYSKTQIWNPDLSIAPMQLTKVQSFHTLTLMRKASSDGPGVFSQFVTGIALEPQIMGNSAALWNAAPAQHTADEPAMVDFGLTGFLLTPIPNTPDVTSAVPLLELLFEEDHFAYFQYTSQQVSTTYSVSSSIDPATEALTITIGGGYSATLPTDNGFILSSLAESWVTTQRNTVLGELTALGFSTFTSAEVDLTAMSTETSLNDWPAVGLLGAA